MKNPNPDCMHECMIQEGPVFSTAVYYPPTYNKQGVNINKDNNKTIGNLKCWTCNKEWRYELQNGEIKFEKLK